MTVCGIICEYNPFHSGHARQLRLARETLGENAVLVCLMSGNYVQRGEPAVFDKMTRARAALDCGADAVLELPVTACLQSAEGFALRGVEILQQLGTDVLCFGCECGDGQALLHTAELMRTPEYDRELKKALQTGCTYAAAREQAVRALDPDALLPQQPNDILALEYCCAILKTHSAMRLLPILRQGSYHAQTPQPDAPSAASLRRYVLEGRDIAPFVPEQAAAVYREAPVFDPACGERAMLARLRTLEAAQWEQTPFGSEGLWSKAWKVSRMANSTEDIVTALKTKRYVRTRLSRLLLCAYLGIDEETFACRPPYVRILGFTERGRAVLRAAKEQGMALINAGQRPDNAAYYALETRAAALYGLFARNPADMSLPLEDAQRVVRG